jgi:hypothetical protein
MVRRIIGLKSRLVGKFLVKEGRGGKLPEAPFFKHDGPEVEIAARVMSG